MYHHATIPERHRQRLLVFNLRTDVDDHILGFTTRWLQELAQYYVFVDVITTHAGNLQLPSNVHVYSVGRERGVKKWGLLLNFYRILSQLLFSHHYDACFAHMQPLFADLAAPLLWLRRIKLTTWYTHRERNQQVVWAERLSYRIVSAVETSFPIKTPKLRAIGHGIDTDFFTPTRQHDPHPRVIYIARLTEIKNQHILLKAIVGLPCQVIFVGDVPDGYRDDYKGTLHRLVAELGLQHQVIFAGAQTPAEVLDWLHGSALAVNLSPTGLFDKGALESMASAVPTIVANEAFAPITGEYHDQLHISAPDDVAGLRQAIAELLALPAETRHQMGADLREKVVEQHSLSALIPRLIQVMHTGEVSGFLGEG